MTKARPLSLRLRNGTYAATNRAYMEVFFRQHVGRWYPGWTLHNLAIADTSSTAFKKSLVYTLTLQQNNKTRVVDIRGNIPSVDTTHEVLRGLQALRAIWNSNTAHQTLTTPRPLMYVQPLRMLVYEAVVGKPLFGMLKKEDGVRCVHDAGAWQAILHARKLCVGRLRSQWHEQREIRYFYLNIDQYYPVAGDECRKLGAAFLQHRQRLDTRIRANRFLMHGDYNPGNILIQPATRALAVIDFGNAWRYDPMSDLANALVQLEITGWQLHLSPSATRRLTTALQKGYGLLSRDQQQRLALFTVWWSLQTLSYVLSLDFVTHKTPMIQRSLQRAHQALTKLEQ